MSEYWTAPEHEIAALEQWALEKHRERADRAEAQIKKLADWIMENVPGEPSQSQGAIDTAIRLLSKKEQG